MRSNQATARMGLAAVTAVLFASLSSAALAAEIVMKVENMCGLSAHDLEVEIWNPPGGYVGVDRDGVVHVDVPEGHKLSVLQRPDRRCTGRSGGFIFWDPQRRECVQTPLVFGPWTPASIGHLLRTVCR